MNTFALVQVADSPAWVGPTMAISLVVIALVWMIPTLGLFLTSLLSAQEVAEGGWWRIFTDPGLATLDNYEAIFDNEDITGSLWTTTAA